MSLDVSLTKVDYDGFVSFVENYLNACVADPDAEIEISR